MCDYRCPWSCCVTDRLFRENTTLHLFSPERVPVTDQSNTCTEVQVGESMSGLLTGGRVSIFLQGAEKRNSAQTPAHKTPWALQSWVQLEVTALEHSSGLAGWQFRNLLSPADWGEVAEDLPRVFPQSGDHEPPPSLLPNSLKLEEPAIPNQVQLTADGSVRNLILYSGPIWKVLRYLLKLKEN